MDGSVDAKQFIEGVERHTKRTMEFAGEVAQIIDTVRAHGMIQEFEEVTFHAKFASQTQEVMKRIGAGAEGYDKLASEFQSSVERVTSLLRAIVDHAPEDFRSRIDVAFLSLNRESFGKLLRLCGDFALIKNWQIDGKPMPYDLPSSVRRPEAREDEAPAPNAHREKGPGATKVARLTKVRSSAVLGILLLLAFVVYDPPVSVTGWILILLVLGLLSNIFLIAFSHRKNGRSWRSQ